MDNHATNIPMRLEVAIIPVSDVDRAKSFYQGLGWRLDVDRAVGDDYRIVQFTPTDSNTAIIFGKGITSARPGAIGQLLLVVYDLEGVRNELRSRGVDVSEMFHDVGGGFGAGFHIGTERRAAGPDPQGRSYASFAAFTDPDGNSWLLQEIKERLPGRLNVAATAQLLHETADHHASFEKSAPPHDWWDWYAAYMNARELGSPPDEASAAATGYMAEFKHIVVLKK